jgi:hypothetical protein
MAPTGTTNQPLLDHSELGRELKNVWANRLPESALPPIADESLHGSVVIMPH